jgi:hypothetical protein
MENEVTTTTSLSQSFLAKAWERLSWVKNKFFLASVFFIVWMLFFDPKDIRLAMDKGAKLKDLQQSERHLITSIEQTKQELNQLKTNAQTIEKYAREKYLMKKDNEDIYIVTAPAKNN